MDLQLSLSLSLAVHFNWLLLVHLQVLPSHLHRCLPLAQLPSNFLCSMVLLSSALLSFPVSLSPLYFTFFVLWKTSSNIFSTKQQHTTRPSLPLRDTGKCTFHLQTFSIKNIAQNKLSLDRNTNNAKLTDTRYSKKAVEASRNTAYLEQTSQNWFTQDFLFLPLFLFISLPRG